MSARIRAAERVTTATRTVAGSCAVRRSLLTSGCGEPDAPYNRRVPTEPDGGPVNTGQDLGYGGLRAPLATPPYLDGVRGDETSTDASVDMDTNLLHGGSGQVCPRCGRMIRDGQAVRRTLSGAYQHDVC
jgi:hypothetical protein